MSTLLLLGCALYAWPVAAQNKWIDAKGRIHYSDLPPPANARVLPMGMAAVAAASSAETLPAELLEATKRNPVVLYTTTECVPCQQARAHLSKRGVPFTEKTITASADIDAFRKLGFSQESFPSVTVGKERAQGFEPAEWTRLLNAASYPENAVLPPSYKQAPASPLAARDSGTPAQASAASSASGTMAPPPQKAALRF